MTRAEWQAAVEACSEPGAPEGAVPFVGHLGPGYLDPARAPRELLELAAEQAADANSIPVPDVPEWNSMQAWSSTRPCVLCGRDASESPYEVVLGDGNMSLFRPEDEQAAQRRHGDVGVQAVGTTCRRKLPAAFVSRRQA